LLGIPADEMLRWLVLLAAPLLDPAAALLVAVATRRRCANWRYDEL
jgi:hypothetical protein